jgi:hypothetical protein
VLPGAKNETGLDQYPGAPPRRPVPAHHARWPSGGTPAYALRGDHPGNSGSGSIPVAARLPLPNYSPIRLMRLSRQLIIYTMMMLSHNSKLANIVGRNGYYHLSLVIPKLLPIWDTWHLGFWLNAVAP